MAIKAINTFFSWRDSGPFVNKLVKRLSVLTIRRTELRNLIIFIGYGEIR